MTVVIDISGEKEYPMIGRIGSVGKFFMTLSCIQSSDGLIKLIYCQSLMIAMSKMSSVYRAAVCLMACPPSYLVLYTI